MNKSTLIETLHKETDLTTSNAQKIVDIFFNEITETLANGDRVEIRGLCSFYAKKYKGYTARNPKTGELVEVKAKKLPFFKSGQELKKMVDYQAK